MVFALQKCTTKKTTATISCHSTFFEEIHQELFSKCMDLMHLCSRPLVLSTESDQHSHAFTTVFAYKRFHYIESPDTF